MVSTHGNISYYVQNLSKRIGIVETDVYLHTASMAFSSSNRQIFLPFFVGATIVIASIEEKSNPMAMFNAIRKQNVTIVDLVPSHMQACVDVLTEKHVKKNKIRLMLSASEPLNLSIVQKWKKILNSDVEYINMYGLTETTGILFTYKITDTDTNTNTNKKRIAPIGFPIDSVIYKLLESNSKNGCLYVKGPTIMQGYLETPQRKNLFFNTGDVCKKNEEGALEYLGRYDRQIKIHGIKINPQEIETVLNSYQGIKESVVVLKKLKNKNYLTAFYSTDSVCLVDCNKFKKDMKNKLPENMIPSFFIELNSIPLSFNGKLDVFSLPPLSSINNINGVNKKSIVLPTGNLQKAILSIWKKTLKKDEISVVEDFFEIGGTSLLAMEIIALLYDLLNIQISLLDIFKYPTIEKLAKFICSRRESKNGK